MLCIIPQPAKYFHVCLLPVLKGLFLQKSKVAFWWNMKICAFDIKRPHFPVLVTLVSIVVVGLIGIPFGDPRFIAYAIFLELVYLTLAVLVAKGYRKPLYVCVLVAIVIIVGNSFVNAHISRMMTLSRPLNTVVLIVGGYLLQGLLVYTSAMALRVSNRPKPRTQ
jgi:hypothetical protein